MNESVTDDGRRQSILKSRPRVPLQEVQFYADEDTVTRGRRVSFGRNLVKEYLVGSAASTLAVHEYEKSSSSFSETSDCSGPLDLAISKSTNDVEIDDVSLVINPAEIYSDGKQIEPPKTTVPDNRVLRFTEGCINIARSVFDSNETELAAIIIGAKTPAADDERRNVSMSFNDVSHFAEDGGLRKPPDFIPLRPEGLFRHETSSMSFDKSKFDFLDRSMTRDPFRSHTAGARPRQPEPNIPRHSYPVTNENVPPKTRVSVMKRNITVVGDVSMEYTGANLDESRDPLYWSNDQRQIGLHDTAMTEGLSDAENSFSLPVVFPSDVDDVTKRFSHDVEETCQDPLRLSNGAEAIPQSDATMTEVTDNFFEDVEPTCQDPIEMSCVSCQDPLELSRTAQDTDAIVRFDACTMPDFLNDDNIRDLSIESEPNLDISEDEDSFQKRLDEVSEHTRSFVKQYKDFSRLGESEAEAQLGKSFAPDENLEDVSMTNRNTLENSLCVQNEIFTPEVNNSHGSNNNLNVSEELCITSRRSFSITEKESEVSRHLDAEHDVSQLKSLHFTRVADEQQVKLTVVSANEAVTGKAAQVSSNCIPDTKSLETFNYDHAISDLLQKPSSQEESTSALSWTANYISSTPFSEVIECHLDNSPPLTVNTVKQDGLRQLLLGEAADESENKHNALQLLHESQSSLKHAMADKPEEKEEDVLEKTPNARELVHVSQYCLISTTVDKEGSKVADLDSFSEEIEAETEQNSAVHDSTPISLDVDIAPPPGFSTESNDDEINAEKIDRHESPIKQNRSSFSTAMELLSSELSANIEPPPGFTPEPVPKELRPVQVEATNSSLHTEQDVDLVNVPEKHGRENDPKIILDVINIVINARVPSPTGDNEIIPTEADHVENLATSTISTKIGKRIIEDETLQNSLRLAIEPPPGFDVSSCEVDALQFGEEIDSARDLATELCTEAKCAEPALGKSRIEILQIDIEPRPEDNIVAPPSAGTSIGSDVVQDDEKGKGDGGAIECQPDEIEKNMILNEECVALHKIHTAVTDMELNEDVLSETQTNILSSKKFPTSSKQEIPDNSHAQNDIDDGFLASCIQGNDKTYTKARISELIADGTYTLQQMVNNTYTLRAGSAADGIETNTYTNLSNSATSGIINATKRPHSDSPCPGELTKKCRSSTSPRSSPKTINWGEQPAEDKSKNRFEDISGGDEIPIVTKRVHSDSPCPGEQLKRSRTSTSPRPPPKVIDWDEQPISACRKYMLQDKTKADDSFNNLLPKAGTADAFDVSLSLVDENLSLMEHANESMGVEEDGKSDLNYSREQQKIADLHADLSSAISPLTDSTPIDKQNNIADKIPESAVEVARDNILETSEQNNEEYSDRKNTADATFETEKVSQKLNQSVGTESEKEQAFAEEEKNRKQMLSACEILHRSRNNISLEFEASKTVGGSEYSSEDVPPAMIIENFNQSQNENIEGCADRSLVYELSDDCKNVTNSPESDDRGSNTAFAGTEYTPRDSNLGSPSVNLNHSVEKAVENSDERHNADQILFAFESLSSGNIDHLSESEAAKITENNMKNPQNCNISASNESNYNPKLDMSELVFDKTGLTIDLPNISVHPRVLDDITCTSNVLEPTSALHLDMSLTAPTFGTNIPSPTFLVEPGIPAEQLKGATSAENTKSYDLRAPNKDLAIEVVKEPFQENAITKEALNDSIQGKIVIYDGTEVTSIPDASQRTVEETPAPSQEAPSEEEDMAGLSSERSDKEITELLPTSHSVALDKTPLRDGVRSFQNFILRSIEKVKFEENSVENDQLKVDEEHAQSATTSLFGSVVMTSPSRDELAEYALSTESSELSKNNSDEINVEFDLQSTIESVVDEIALTPMESEDTINSIPNDEIAVCSTDIDMISVELQCHSDDKPVEESESKPKRNRNLPIRPAERIDLKVKDVLKDRLLEENCLWKLVDPEEEGKISIAFPLIDTRVLLTVECGQVDNVLKITAINVVELPTDEYQHPSLMEVNTFGFNLIRDYISGEESKMRKNFAELPYFVDFINAFSRKVVNAMKNAYQLLRGYAGARLEEYNIRFKVHTFPTLTICTISANLKDAIYLGRPTLKFDYKMGCLNENGVSRVLRSSWNGDFPLLKFVIAVKDYLVEIEKSNHGCISKRFPILFEPLIED